MMSLQEIRSELDRMSPQQQLLIAYWILEKAVQPEPDPEREKPKRNLLSIAGILSGGPSDVSERAEEILMENVNPISGFSIN